jgi:poly-gamma-glutamate capsule biosynthesis protein CapA/YwtB (metallophosphatase superfamily)
MKDCVAVASVHWGVNWGYEVTAEQKRLAHALIDESGFDIVFCHSSHHVKGIEIHNEKPAHPTTAC